MYVLYTHSPTVNNNNSNNNNNAVNGKAPAVAAADITNAVDFFSFFFTVSIAQCLAAVRM